VASKQHGFGVPTEHAGDITEAIRTALGSNDQLNGSIEGSDTTASTIIRGVVGHSWCNLQIVSTFFITVVEAAQSPHTVFSLDDGMGLKAESAVHMLAFFSKEKKICLSYSTFGVRLCEHCRHCPCSK
jgi:hypothetical protein